VGKGVQEAQLQLNPKDMGPVQVWIALDNNAAQVRFAAEHSATREALQAALPELAQALARDGLQLDSASVQARAQGGTDMGSPGGFAQTRQQGDAPADGRRGFLPAQPLSASPPARAIGSAGANLLDLYA
jgi:flagellar hook-length control protein FliK